MRTAEELRKEIIPKMAELEVAILKESGQIVLDKEKFDPTNNDTCFYGQVFGRSYNEESMNFKKSHGIFIIKSHLSFLEEFLCDLWEDNQKEKVYKIVEQFATWKEAQKEQSEENLFTY